MPTIYNTIQQRRGTAAAWTAADPVLLSGEQGWETDTLRMKIGDGLTHWTVLPYHPTISTSEWIQQVLSGLLYISATQFQTSGDQSALFPVGIRVKATVTAGTIYGSVSAVSASGLPVVTTVTVSWDSGSLDNGLSVVYTGIFSPVNTSVPPSFFTLTGMVIPYAGDVAPIGWLLCYGQEISRTTYATLFAICGTKFGGGDGSTTFNLPDLRGRGIVGPDDMGGSAANRIAGLTAGESGGAEAADLSHTHETQGHALTENEMPSHVHQMTLYYQWPMDEMVGGEQGTGPKPTPATAYTMTTQSAGNGAEHEHGATESAGSATQSILNPHQAINSIIKY